MLRFLASKLVKDCSPSNPHVLVVDRGIHRVAISGNPDIKLPTGCVTSASMMSRQSLPAIRACNRLR
jgi:hypothetical protein